MGLKTYTSKQSSDFLDTRSRQLSWRKELFVWQNPSPTKGFETWWAFLRKSNTEWWISIFKDFTAFRHIDNSNVIHVECLRFCFMHLIQEELHRVSQHWNLYRIRPSNGQTLPGDLIFCFSFQENRTPQLQNFG